MLADKNRQRWRLAFLAATVVASGCSHTNWVAVQNQRGSAYREYAASDWKACARDFADVGHAIRPGTEALVSAACCQARAGNVEAAIETLEEASARGLHDPASLETDDDLAVVRQSPAWEPLLAKVRKKHEVYEASVNHELRALARDDQADRIEPIDWPVVTPRDEARRARVYEMLSESSLKLSEDFMNAAVILNHGDKVQDIVRAHEAALKAVELEPSRVMARMLAGATEDRALMMRNVPQRYGTQLHGEGAHYELYRVDPAVTDAERAKWFLPSLQRVRKNLELMNQVH